MWEANLSSSFVHISKPVSVFDLGEPGIICSVHVSAGVNQEQELVRLGQAELLVAFLQEYTREHEAVVLAGDFNSDPGPLQICKVIPHKVMLSD